MNGNLQQIRQTRVLSRKELAQQSRVNESTIYRAEHGQTKLRPSTVRKLAQALGVPPDQLLSKQGRLGL
ncbi:MAG: helix-turn-helix transcriptional regulator [Dehalococcoidia bacterium]|jgi:transcriptional regulator with XRE-family HTH domain